MPNHNINEVTIFGDKSTRNIAREICLSVDPSSDEAFIDFSVLLPKPLNFWDGNVSTIHEETFPGTGLKWATENWGTKWNAYEQGMAEGEHGSGRYHRIVEKDNCIILTFQTAWGPPMGWLVAVFNKLKTNMTVLSFSEGGSAYQSHFFMYDKDEKFSDMKYIRNSHDDDTSDEFRRLHTMLWGVPFFEDE